MYLFLDESGDLGFDLSKQGTSKYFTICLLVCDDTQITKEVIFAVKKTLHKINKKRKNPLNELKSTQLSDDLKHYFLRSMPVNGWGIYAITIDKIKRSHDLQTLIGKQKLYNLLTNKLLSHLPNDTTIQHISLVVDKCQAKFHRTIFNTMIETHLLDHFDRTDICINIDHRNSEEHKAIQATDLFCSGIRRFVENKDLNWYSLFADKIKFQGIL
jgi:hypothetical protein